MFARRSASRSGRALASAEDPLGVHPAEDLPFWLVVPSFDRDVPNLALRARRSGVDSACQSFFYCD